MLFPPADDQIVENADDGEGPVDASVAPRLECAALSLG